MFKSNLRQLVEIFLVSTKLGLTSFGGPVAHLGYFHHEYVQKRKWLDEESYADLVALCQFLPGPASSQVGIGIGSMRAGVLGGLVAFMGFTLPSVLVLMVFALFFEGTAIGKTGWIHGLKIVAVAIVAQAIVEMAKKLVPDLKRKMIALLALSITLLWETTLSQLSVIFMSGLLGLLFYQSLPIQLTENNSSVTSKVISRRFGISCLILFVVLLIGLPLFQEMTNSKMVAIFDSFYRSGALVFGGGHVVLPLFEREFVTTGLIHPETFLAGYGVTQAVPGPLFTFATYLGTILASWQGGLLATLAIFLPGGLLILGVLPFWELVRQLPKIKGALMGVNAAVVGLLIAAFYQPIWQSTIIQSRDFVFAACLFSLLTYLKIPSWLVVILGAIGGAIMALF
ncbi:chromate transporter [Vagococcus penaei]|nr:chromate transporter [Vagococcus penaei]